MPLTISGIVLGSVFCILGIMKTKKALAVVGLLCANAAMSYWFWTMLI